jgi:hypothetical protein
MPDTHLDTRRIELPMQVRLQPVATINAEKRTAELVWAAGGRVLRFDWWTGERYWEELSLEPGAVRMQRLENGAPLLNTHSRYELGDVIGVVEDARLENGQGVATVRFSKREDVEPIFQDVRDGIIRAVSVGYVVHRYLKLDPPAGSNDFPTWRAIDWEPSELSLVPIGADVGAQVRSALAEEQLAKVRTYACEFVNTPAAAAGSSSTTRNQETTMPDKGNPAVPAAEPNAGTQQSEAQRQEAVKAERARVTEIQRRCREADLGEDGEALATRLVDDGSTVDTACRAIVDAIAARKKAPPTNATRTVEIVEDERVKLRSAISSALVHRVNPRGELPNNGAGDFRYFPLSRLAEEVLKREGVRVSGLSPNEIVARAMHSTSDFSYILADASNKRLRDAYNENVPSYMRWARRAANAPDFKTINVTQLSGAPDLLKVLEGGEFKRGKVSDNKETYQVFTYGRIIGISRQAIVNDDLSAFDRTPRLLAAAARRLENATVYGILTANGTMTDGGALFNVTAVTTAGGHANLATGTGSALSLTSLTTARTAMRKQVGLSGEPLNLAPAFLIVGAELEQAAYQYTSPNFTPAQPSSVNEFRQGGKTALEPIVEALLSGSSTTAWYLAADANQIDTVEYAFLDGSEGLYLESQVNFNTDGVEFKARLDFAAGAVDHRGLYKSNGA